MLDALAILVWMALVMQITGVDILMPDTLVNIPTSSSSSSSTSSSPPPPGPSRPPDLPQYVEEMILVMAAHCT